MFYILKPLLCYPRLSFAMVIASDKVGTSPNVDHVRIDRVRFRFGMAKFMCSMCQKKNQPHFLLFIFYKESRSGKRYPLIFSPSSLLGTLARKDTASFEDRILFLSNLFFLSTLSFSLKDGACQ